MRPHEARRDAYRRMAREQGYRSRSAYKLKELNRAYRVIGAGFGVLDVGCCPGGWTQVAVQLAGSRGRVMGIDTSHTEEVPGARTVRLDVSGDGVAGEVLGYFGKRVDAVVCDLSPQVSGNWSVDHARQVSLNYDASRVMARVLARGGNAVFKVFDGEYSAEFSAHVKRMFSRTRSTKPRASRKTSSETYVVCLGHTGG